MPNSHVVTAARPADEQCWCCGVAAPPSEMVRLGNHPEVAICPRCARWLRRRAREVEDRSRGGRAVAARNLIRTMRRAVVRRGWHRHPRLGKVLRWIDRRLP